MKQDTYVLVDHNYAGADAVRGVYSTLEVAMNAAPPDVAWTHSPLARGVEHWRAKGPSGYKLVIVKR